MGQNSASNTQAAPQPAEAQVLQCHQLPQVPPHVAFAAVHAALLIDYDGDNGLLEPREAAAR